MSTGATGTAGAPLDWFAYLQDRLQVAVQEAVAAGNDPDDALRGLYISDEQALSLAAESAALPPAAALREAAQRLDLDELDTSVLALCAAPELHPRFGRLYAYLQDDVTRRLASPRLAADLLAGPGVTRSDVLACFSPGATLQRTGAIRMPTPEATTTLADRPVKVADRLAAFLLGAGGLGAVHGGVRLRALEAQPATGRQESVERIALLLAARTRLPLVVCGPDAGAIVACAAGAPLVLLGARELDSPEAVADAWLAATLAGAQLTIDGLEDLSPPERAQLLAVDRGEPAPAGAHRRLGASRHRAGRSGGAHRRGPLPELRRAPRGVGALQRGRRIPTRRPPSSACPSNRSAPLPRSA